MIGTTEHYPAALQDSSGHSGVSWAAIFAGAAAAAALSLLLLRLGAGLGFSAVSPWSGEGVGAKGLGITAIIWLAVTQIIASGMGGYLAGRLRVKWANMHGDEVYFRDTAHGFLAWAVATLVTATLVAGSVSSVIGSGVQAGANVASGAATAMSSAAGSAAGNHANNGAGNSSDYFIDTLFRDDRGKVGAPFGDHRVGLAEPRGGGIQPLAEHRLALGEPALAGEVVTQIGVGHRQIEHAAIVGQLLACRQ